RPPRRDEAPDPPPQGGGPPALRPERARRARPADGSHELRDVLRVAPGRSLRAARHPAAPGLRAGVAARPSLSAPGKSAPASAPARDRAAATPSAGTKPSLNACGEPYPPAWANTATAIAVPNTPPSWRSML